MNARYDLISREFLMVVTFAFFGSLILVPRLRLLAYRIGAVDVPEKGRRIHASETPRIGGLAIIFVFIMASMLLLISKATSNLVSIGLVHQLRVYVFGIAIVVFIGLYDDIFRMNAWKKFAVEIFISLLLYSGGLRIEVLSLFPGYDIHLGILSVVVTTLWVVGVMNSVNLIDGLDGLCAGICSVVLLAIGMVGLLEGRFIEAALPLVLVAAVLGFLPYNLNPARTFLGDTGSLVLGFSIASFGMWNFRSSTGGFLPLFALACLIVPAMDTLFAIARRMYERVPIFQADLGHIHHRLYRLGFTQNQILLILSLITFMSCVSGWLLSYGSPENMLVGLVFFGSIIFFLVVLYAMEPLEKSLGLSGRFRLAASFRDVVVLRRTKRNLRGTHTVDEIQRVLMECFAAWQPSRINVVVEDGKDLQLSVRDQAGGKFPDSPGWDSGAARKRQAGNTLLINLHSEDRFLGKIELVFGKKDAPVMARAREMCSRLEGSLFEAMLLAVEYHSREDDRGNGSAQVV